MTIARERTSTDAPHVPSPLMLIVHANWSRGALHLWAEEVARLRDNHAAQAPQNGASAHPFAANAERHLAVQAVQPGLHVR